MAQNDPAVRSNHRTAAFLAIVAVAWLGMAAWALARGDIVEAVGHVLVAVLAATTAILIGNPSRPRAIQMRIVIGALTLVPIILAIFIASIFF